MLTTFLRIIKCFDGDDPTIDAMFRFRLQLAIRNSQSKLVTGESHMMTSMVSGYGIVNLAVLPWRVTCYLLAVVVVHRSFITVIRNRIWFLVDRHCYEGIHLRFVIAMDSLFIDLQRICWAATIL